MMNFREEIAKLLDRKLVELDADYVSISYFAFLVKSSVDAKQAAEHNEDLVEAVIDVLATELRDDHSPK